MPANQKTTADVVSRLDAALSDIAKALDGEMPGREGAALQEAERQIGFQRGRLAAFLPQPEDEGEPEG